MNKTAEKRILICNDAHFLNTGYAVYGKNLLEYLTNTGKYKIAELACYGKVNDERSLYAKWRYYANHVDSNHPQHSLYMSNPQNEFGKWRFDRVCLDFKPTHVLDIRDPWMLTFESMSPLRDYYQWLIMPTVDSAPQKEEWLDIFSDADAIFTYTDWGKSVLDKQSNNRINTVCAAPPGVDINVFKPVKSKEQHRDMMGFFSDCNIIGTIMRNQPRKLYPDLFMAFRKFIDKCYANNESELANKTYLYVHCSYPDSAWEIPELLREFGLGRKVIFTYICSTCKHVTCNFFKDARAVCKRCNTTGAVLPNTNLGLSPQQLAQIYNLFDIYIQYSVCEGFGMPQVEAASCGVPVMSVDYSAMWDIVRKLKGIPLKVERMFRDIGTGSYRALPDNEYCANKIYEFVKQPVSIRRVAGNKARKAVEKQFTWERTCKIWENYLDNSELVGLQGKWDSPIKPLRGCPTEIPNLNNADFVDWAILNVMQEPRFLHSRFALNMLRELNYGGRNSDRKFVPITQKSIYQNLLTYAQNKEDCEHARCGLLELNRQDYIQHAHEREKYL